MDKLCLALQEAKFFEKTLPRLHWAMRGMMEVLGPSEVAAIWKSKEPKSDEEKDATAKVAKTPVKSKSPRSSRKKVEDLESILDSKVIVDREVFKSWLGQPMEVDVRLRDRLFIIQVRCSTRCAAQTR